MKDQSALRWPQWPVAGAVGAGRHDELPPPPAGFGPTPSAFVQEEPEQEVPVEGSQ